MENKRRVSCYDGSEEHIWIFLSWSTVVTSESRCKRNTASNVSLTYGISAHKDAGLISEISFLCPTAPSKFNVFYVVFTVRCDTQLCNRTPQKCTFSA